jgi:hypothetical protein
MESGLFVLSFLGDQMKILIKKPTSASHIVFRSAAVSRSSSGIVLYLTVL